MKLSHKHKWLQHFLFVFQNKSTPVDQKVFFIVKYLQKRKLQGRMLYSTGIYLSTQDYIQFYTRK